MRMLFTAMVAMSLSACAVHRVPDRIISTSWATVQALGRGTEIGVAFDDGQVEYGRLTDVSPASLTLRERHGASVIERKRVARLAVRNPTGSSRVPNVIKGAVSGAIIGGVLAWIAHSVEENSQNNGGTWAGLLLTTGAGAAIGSAWPPAERYDERVVYIRP